MREVEPLLRESVELVREEEGDDSREYVAALNELGSLLRALKQLDESEAAFVKAAEIEAAGARHRGQRRLRHLHQQPGRHLPPQGRVRKAEALFRESMEIYERTVGTEHFVYLSALNNLGLVYQDLKRYDEARGLHEQALAVLGRAASATPPTRPRSTTWPRSPWPPGGTTTPRLPGRDARDCGGRPPARTRCSTSPG